MSMNNFIELKEVSAGSTGSANSASLVNHLPFWHFDGDLMVYGDGSVGCGFKIEGKDIVNLLNNEINDFTVSLENLINTIPEGTRTQIFYRLSNKVTPMINRHVAATEGVDKNNENNESRESKASKESVNSVNADPYKNIFDSRINHLKNKVNKGEFFTPEIYLFIRSNPFNYSSKKIWERKQNFKSIGQQKYEEQKERFNKIIKQVDSGLGSCGLQPRMLKQEEWVNLLYEYLNLSRSEKISPPKLREGDQLFASTLGDQIVLSDVGFDKHGLEIGDYLFQTITLKIMPELTYSSMSERFLKLPFNFWMSVNFLIPDQKQEIDRLQFKRRLTHSFASSSNNLRDLESESKLSHIEELISELLESTEKIVSAEVSVIVWGKDQRELEEKSYEVLRHFKELNQSEGLVETYHTFDVFMKAIPGSCDGTRNIKMKSSNLVHLLPLYSYWNGNSNPVCLLSNRQRTLVGIDPFDPKLPNWNGLIVGSSGSGKSFMTSQLILMFIGQTPKPKIVWLDNGASSKNLVETLDGQFIDLNIDSTICLNMFDLDKGEIVPSASKVKLILAVLESIFCENKESGISKIDKAQIEECIFKVYESVNEENKSYITPTLSDFRQMLEKHQSSTLRDYAKVLYSWTGKTAYGKMLDGKTNIMLEKDLVSIELKGLDIYPDLQNVFLFLLTDFFKREAAKDTNQKYLLIIDESWKLFESQSGAAFAIEAYRTFRKYNSGIWSISQNINDFRGKEEIANSILQNTPTRIILKQRGIDWKEFQRILDLKDIEIEIIKSLTQEKGKFSEFYFIQNDRSSILVMEPDALSYWICTTDPVDKSKISEVQYQYPKISKIDLFKKVSSLLSSVYVFIYVSLFIGIGTLTFNPSSAWALFDSAVQIPYLAQILAENIKQYKELKKILQQGKYNEEYLAALNRGMDNAYGLLQTFPIKDERILREIRDFQSAYQNVKTLYGNSKSGIADDKMFELHDKTVAESIRMASNLPDYANIQEENSQKLWVQSEQASPKGAARMSVQINSQILHTLTQLLRVNGQLLKLQSEMMGMQNKQGKESSEHYDKLKSDIKNEKMKPSRDFFLPKFK
ncbi:MAG: ATP-binding protein [Oligoflexia bacterium]|nr:ATP-binding protein [Oligoflexia bacterium]